MSAFQFIPFFTALAVTLRVAHLRRLKLPRRQFALRVIIDLAVAVSILAIYALPAIDGMDPALRGGLGLLLAAVGLLAAAWSTAHDEGRYAAIKFAALALILVLAYAAPSLSPDSTTPPAPPASIEQEHPGCGGLPAAGTGPCVH